MAKCEPGCTCGRHFQTPEHIEKVRQARIGVPLSATHRLNLSISHKGQRRPMLQATKDKISVANKGHTGNRKLLYRCEVCGLATGANGEHPCRYIRLGVYRIRNFINDKEYIGSSQNIGQRWWHHRIVLRQGNHRSHLLQKEYDIYGEENFVFEILEEIPKENKDDLLEKEQY